jgi:hypothetical protein
MQTGPHASRARWVMGVETEIQEVRVSSATVFSYVLCWFRTEKSGYFGCIG